MLYSLKVLKLGTSVILCRPFSQWNIVLITIYYLELGFGSSELFCLTLNESQVVDFLTYYMSSRSSLQLFSPQKIQFETVHFRKAD